MRLPVLRRARSAEPGVTTGTVRLDRRTKRLVGRLRPGDIAVIDHVDLDRVAADSLVAVGVAAVLNAKPSISGRYPNLGPEVLIQAGIPLVDACRMAATTPAAALGLGIEVGALRTGLRADLVELSEDLQVVRVMRAGTWR